MKNKLEKVIAAVYSERKPDVLVLLLGTGSIGVVAVDLCGDVYVVCMWLFGMNTQEKKMVTSILRKVFSVIKKQKQG